MREETKTTNVPKHNRRNKQTHLFLQESTSNNFTVDMRSQLNSKNLLNLLESLKSIYKSEIENKILNRRMKNAAMKLQRAGSNIFINLRMSTG